MTTKAIEAGARAMKRGVCLHCRSPAIGEGGGIVDCDCPNRAWDTPTDLEKAQAAIEAALASGELVPASAVAAERERCAAIIDSYAQPDRFKPSEQWKEDMTVAEVYETGVIDAMGWAAKEVRSLSSEPASGEFVMVPRVPTQAMIYAGHDAVSGAKIVSGWPGVHEIYRAMLNAATKDGERK